MSNIVGIPMCFACQGVCVMHYCGPMRYAVQCQFPAHQLDGRMELCVIRGYALSEVCVKRGLTVVLFFTCLQGARPVLAKREFYWYLPNRVREIPTQLSLF